MRGRAGRRGPSTVGTAAAGAALIAVALNLRIVIAAVPPVLSQIQHSTGLGASGTGVLTAVPVICFGAVALAAPHLIRRFGMAPLLGLTMLAVAGGSAIRLANPVALLFAGTAVLGAGIAVANVLLPGIIKRDFADRVPVMMALYSVSLFVGPALSAGLTVPIEHATGMGWRPTIALWGGLAILGAAAWAPFVRSRSTRPGPGPAPASPANGAPVRGLWSDRLAWQVTLFMGLQSFGYYAMLNWIPTILEDHGMGSARAGWMLSYSAFPGMAAALATPFVARRLRGPLLPVVAVALCAVAYLGLLVAPTDGTYGWMTILGLGQGVAIALALGYIVARSPDHRHAAHLSTMAQGVGYLIACTGPFLLGTLHGATRGWTVPLLVVLVALLPLLVAGLGASRDRHVLAGAASGGVPPPQVVGSTTR